MGLEAADTEVGPPMTGSAAMTGGVISSARSLRALCMRSNPIGRAVDHAAEQPDEQAAVPASVDDRRAESRRP